MLGADPFVSALLATMAVAAISELLARIAHCPTLVFLLAGVIPIVPGSFLYRMMKALIEKNVSDAFSYGSIALKISLGVAGGIVAIAATISILRGIINKLDKNELTGVIAHEMAHIGNRDIRLDMLMITGIGVTVFIADIMSRTIMYGDHHRTSNNNNRDNSAAILMMVWLAFTVFNFIITPLLRMAVSRNREYAADATGALITRDPKSLASALKKISSDSRIKSMDNVKSMAAICIANPSKPSQFVSELFATHPPIKNRIKKLNSMI
jgi:Zn-dependent protease with chaperone function